MVDEKYLFKQIYEEERQYVVTSSLVEDFGKTIILCCLDG